MNKYFAILAAVALSAVTSMTAQAAISVTGLHNTGENPVESNYVLSSGVTPNTVPAVYADLSGNTFPGAWADNPSGANWIGPVAFSGMAPINSAADDTWVGFYDYTLTFQVTGDVADLAGLAIVGNWATDNNGWILLNSTNTGYSLTNGFKPSLPFALTTANGLTMGWNTLTFRIENIDFPASEYGKGHINPTGLLVSDLHATPEPSTVVIWGALASLGGVVVWKKRNA